jgi:hypothetical protein
MAPARFQFSVRIIASVVQIRVVTAAVVLGALAGVAAITPALAKAPPPPHGRGAATAAQVVSAHLHISDRNPRQLRGVLLDASSSTGDIVAYEFHYGDGVVEHGVQPVASHGYQNTGTYHATVVVTGRTGDQATSIPETIRVRDGIPPVVSIDSPRPDQRVRLGKSGLVFKGAASDAGSGVSKVALAIQLLHPPRHLKTPRGSCVWFDSHQWLLLSGCSSPYYFPARYGHGRWSFRMDPRARIPAGTYVVRVIGIDRAGNISHYFAITLHTIFPFQLVR